MTLRRFPHRTTTATSLIAAAWWCGMFGGLFASTATAQTWSPRSSPYYTVDPFDVVPPPGTVAAGASMEVRPQFSPYGRGYNLVGGFRPTYQGVPQPIGHEIISTHNGNGYVYRPVYAPSYGYHYTPQGALVIERPGRYPISSASAPYATMPSLPAAPSLPQAIPTGPMTAPRPNPASLPPTGPREF